MTSLRLGPGRWLSRPMRTRVDWVSPDTTLGQVLRGARIGAVVTFLIVLVVNWSRYGVPFDRTTLLLWIAIGLACACVGRHPVWLAWVVVDFVPLAAVLIAYDHLRGIADTVGLPTWWHPQIDLDRALTGGTTPTVWLQEHLRYAHVRWYDVLACACYYSFFFLPYLTAGVLWLRGRRDFYRWSLRFVALSFVGFGLFVLIPAAPPWAAARCSAAQVAGHPNAPNCMFFGPTASDGLLGRMSTHRPGTHPYVERIVTRGFSELHLKVATSLLQEGRVSADAVAAVPSLHLGGTMLFVLFLWPRVRRAWRPLLVAYPLVMTFSLVYTAEHYVADCVAGALLALAVHRVGLVIERRIERRRNRSRPLDTLDRLPGVLVSPAAAPTPDDRWSSPCPPSPSPPGTTPSST